MILLSFLLKGKVQGVKMRRYIESAGRYFGVSGFVINIDENDDTDPGAVFGQAWVSEVGDKEDNSDISKERLDSFQRWIQGGWVPKVFTNIKPTPIGTAYPEKARVEQFSLSRDEREAHACMVNFQIFEMVRDDELAMLICEETIQDRSRLSKALSNSGLTNNKNFESTETPQLVWGSWTH